MFLSSLVNKKMFQIFIHSSQQLMLKFELIRSNFAYAVTLYAFFLSRYCP